MIEQGLILLPIRMELCVMLGLGVEIQQLREVFEYLLLGDRLVDVHRPDGFLFYRQKLIFLDHQ